MAEEQTQQQEPAGGEGAHAPEPTDWKAEARKWEKRSKENAEKAKAYDELQERSKTDLQKAQEAADGYRKRLEEIESRAALDRARAKVAQETGVPASLVMGDDEESMREFAKAVAEYAKPKGAPRVKAPGRFANDAGDAGDAAKMELRNLMFGS